MANLFNQSPQQEQNPMIQQIRANPRAYIEQLKKDPAGFLRQCGYSIPDGMNNPMQIAQQVFGPPPQVPQGKR